MRWYVYIDIGYGKDYEGLMGILYPKFVKRTVKMMNNENISLVHIDGRVNIRHKDVGSYIHKKMRLSYPRKTINTLDPMLYMGEYQSTEKVIDIVKKALEICEFLRYPVITEPPIKNIKRFDVNDDITLIRVKLFATELILSDEY